MYNIYHLDMEVEHKINRLSKLMSDTQNREMISQIKDFMNNHNNDLSNFNHHDIESMILYLFLFNK